MPGTYTFEMTGGAVCLDFINTLEDRPRGDAEHLHRYADLLDWGEQAGLIEHKTAQRMKQRARKHPRTADATFAKARALREQLYRVFAATIRGSEPPPADLSAFNQALADALAKLRLHEDRGSFVWVWHSSGNDWGRMLWPVLRSAAELLTSDERGLVRECHSETCSWLFIDRSRTKRRRWCDMKTCGNRAKARRHYRKTRSAGSEH